VNDISADERQQLANIRDWVKSHSLLIVAALIGISAVFFGPGIYQSYQNERTWPASDAYEEFLEAVAQVPIEPPAPEPSPALTPDPIPDPTAEDSPQPPAEPPSPDPEPTADAADPATVPAPNPPPETEIAANPDPPTADSEPIIATDPTAESEPPTAPESSETDPSPPEEPAPEPTPLERADALADRIIDQHGNTHYAVLASLVAAKLSADLGHFEAAHSRLLWAESRAKNPADALLINFRLALLEAELDEPQKALARLQTDNPHFAPLYFEAAGDIHTHLAQRDQAIAAYQRALDSLPAAEDDQATAEANALRRRNLQIKFDNLTIGLASLPSDPPEDSPPETPTADNPAPDSPAPPPDSPTDSPDPPTDSTPPPETPTNDQ